MKNALNFLCTVMECGKRLPFMSFVSPGSATYDEHTCRFRHSWHSRTLVKDDVELIQISEYYKINQYYYSSRKIN